jgi:hypothetical protein
LLVTRQLHCHRSTNDPASIAGTAGIADKSNEGRFAPAPPPPGFRQAAASDLAPVRASRGAEPTEAAELEMPAPAAVHGFQLFTVSLIVLLAIVFAAELALDRPGGKPLTPSLSTLYLMGASSRTAIFDPGEWWRLLASAPQSPTRMP